jgi:CheY-like chemotaxis protein
MTKLKTCFLIDDDEDDREIFQLALEQVDSKVTCVVADNCMDALEQLRSGNLDPDYIFLDLNMPVLTGRECLMEIRKMQQFLNTPVLIYTTSSVPKDKEDMMALGATSFITKPNKVSVLTTVLNEVLTAS